MPKQIPAAAVTIMPNLICYCSTATVTCIWYIDFLPPHRLGPLAGVFFSSKRDSLPPITVQGSYFQTLSAAVCWQEMQQKGTRPCAARWPQMDDEMLWQRTAGRAGRRYQMLKSPVILRAIMYLSGCPRRCHACGDWTLSCTRDVSCAGHPFCWLIP